MTDFVPVSHLSIRRYQEKYSVWHGCYINVKQFLYLFGASNVRARGLFPWLTGLDAGASFRTEQKHLQCVCHAVFFFSSFHLLSIGQYRKSL